MVGFLYYTTFPQNPQGKADLPVADSPFQGRSRRRRKLRRISFTPWKKGHDWQGERGYTLHYEVNDFSNEANILYAEFQDLNFEYRLSSILFEDGTQEFFEKREGTVEL